MNNPASSPANGPWFESWFNSPYYEKVYDHRNLSEAKDFIKNLTQWLQLPSNAQILDLGCGWGRHTRSLAELGYDATGIDLSPRLIAKAIEHFMQAGDPISQRIKFCVGDMRDFQLNTEFDLIVNLFTSFGYFENTKQDLKVIQNAHHHLKSTGFFVLDYFNKESVISNFRDAEYHHGLEYDTKILRSIEQNQLIKSIEIIHKTPGRSPESYFEKVRCYDKSQLESMLNSAGLEVIQQWGTYQLSPADAKSPRCILLARKFQGQAN